jgi:hypothetical protein
VKGGQASVEAIAGVAIVLLAGLVGFQLLAVGYAAVMADHAAEAGALAIANGSDPDEAAAASVPGWPRAAIETRPAGGRIFVTLVPPSPLRFLRQRLSIRAEAAVRAPAGVSRPPPGPRAGRPPP